MTTYTSIRDVLSAARERLAASSDSPSLDAELLLARALDVRRSYLIAHPEDAPDAAALKRFATSLARRLAGEPIAYILGEWEFWSLSLMVAPTTLVPRPETELLVELALSVLPRQQQRRVADLGTGSGAIALAIARERPLCDIVATDISAAALDVAHENARQHDISNVSFATGDWSAPLAGQSFDLVVSNPPYVREDDPCLSALRHEPQSALIAGADGLDAIRTLARECQSIVDAGGTLLLEHGAEQGDAVRGILAHEGWTEVQGHHDLAGHPRAIAAKRPRRPPPGA